MIEELNSELQAMISALSSILSVDGRVPETGGSAQIDTSEYKELCRSLMELLVEQDARTIGFFEEHRTVFAAGLGGQYEELAENIDDFDFDAALKILNCEDGNE